MSKKIIRKIESVDAGREKIFEIMRCFRDSRTGYYEGGELEGYFYTLEDAREYCIYEKTFNKCWYGKDDYFTICEMSWNKEEEEYVWLIDGEEFSFNGCDPVEVICIKDEEEDQQEEYEEE